MFIAALVYTNRIRNNLNFLFGLLKMLYYVGVSLNNKVVVVSSVQQSDSVIHINVSILFQILFPFRLLQNMEQHSLCCIVGPRCLSVLNIAVSACPKD